MRDLKTILKRVLKYLNMRLEKNIGGMSFYSLYNGLTYKNGCAGNVIEIFEVVEKICYVSWISNRIYWSNEIYLSKKCI